jgi:hypothetical protein
MKAGHINCGAILPCKLIFKGGNFLEQGGAKKPKEYNQIDILPIYFLCPVI